MRNRGTCIAAAAATVVGLLGPSLLTWLFSL
jgi:hypothetical protein